MVIRALVDAFVLHYPLQLVLVGLLKLFLGGVSHDAPEVLVLSNFACAFFSPEGLLHKVHVLVESFPHNSAHRFGLEILLFLMRLMPV